MAEELQNARIDQLPQSAGPKPGFFLAMRNMELGITQRIEVDYFLTSSSTQNFEWITDHEYAVNDVVTRSGRWWQSLQINENVVPGTDPLTWVEIPRSPSGFVYWQAGAFVEDENFVMYEIAGVTYIYRLDNATRPYISTDFEAELLAGDWELLGASTIYNLVSPTTITVGGLPSGTDITGWSTNEILQAILTGEIPGGMGIYDSSYDTSYE